MKYTNFNVCLGCDRDQNTGCRVCACACASNEPPQKTIGKRATRARRQGLKNYHTLPITYGKLCWVTTPHYTKLSKMKQFVIISQAFPWTFVIVQENGVADDLATTCIMMSCFLLQSLSFVDANGRRSWLVKTKHPLCKTRSNQSMYTGLWKTFCVVRWSVLRHFLYLGKNTVGKSLRFYESELEPLIAVSTCAHCNS